MTDTATVTVDSLLAGPAHEPPDRYQHERLVHGRELDADLAALVAMRGEDRIEEGEARRLEDWGDMIAAAQLRLFSDHLIRRAVDADKHGRRYGSDPDRRLDVVGALLNSAAEARGMAAVVAGTAHVPYDCTARTGRCQSVGLSCMFCEGGLFACLRCDAFEGKATTDCPAAVGVSLLDDIGDAVYAGKLDYYDGRWYRAASPHVPGPWTLADAVETLWKPS